MNKKQVRLTESDLKQIVKESVNKILNEADGFKQVNNLNDYVASNGLQMKPASKFQRVNAQSGKSYINQYGKQNGMDKRQIGRMVRKGGAPLTTVAGDGTQETNNMVTKNHTVLNNIGNTSNKWAAETPTFKRKYEQDPSNRGTYKPKGGPMNAAQINEPISFTAPWGEKMNVDKGGYILQDPNNPNDIYGISGKDFDSTYRFNEGKNRIRMSETQLRQIIKESIEQVLNEGVGDYFGAIRRGWNTPVKSYEFGNTKGALKAMDSIENRALQHQMNTERGIGLQGYNTKFEQDVKNWLRGDTVRINDKMSPKTQQYWRQVKAKADEILNNYGKEKVMGVLGTMRSRF